MCSENLKLLFHIHHEWCGYGTIYGAMKLRDENKAFGLSMASEPCNDSPMGFNLKVWRKHHLIEEQLSLNTALGLLETI
jgi:hypothetical protein